MKLLCGSSKSNTVLFALIFSLLLSHIQAQSTPPIPRRRQSYTTINSKFYIHGGYTWQGSGIYTTQFYDLDLTTSWTDAAPNWEKLTDGPLISHHSISYVAPEHSAGLGTGKSGYIVAIGGTNQKNISSFLNVYDIGAGTWSVPTLPTPYQALEGHSVARNPNNGFLYIVGGFWNITQVINAPVNNSFTVFDPSTGTFPYIKQAQPAESLIDAQAVWSSKKNKIMVFGGTRANPRASLAALGLDKVTEINPVDFTSVVSTTTGNVPNRVWDHCGAISDDGSKVYIFGGQTDTLTFSDDLYVLNVDNYTWTQLRSSSSTRTRMSCGFHQNQFFAWGGSVGADASTIFGSSSSSLSGAPIIYDPLHDTWSPNYYANGPPASPTSDGTKPPQPNDSTNGNGANGAKTNLAPIIGGAAGGVVLIALVSYVIYLRRRQNYKQPYSETVVTSSVDDEDDRIITHARKNRPVERQYSTVDSDIDGSYNHSDRSFSKNNSFMMDQYNASAAIGAPYTRPSMPYQRPNIRSGHWEEGSDFSGKGQDFNFRPISGVSSLPSEGQFKHSRPSTETFNIQLAVGPPSPSGPSNQQDAFLQQSSRPLSHQQQLQQPTRPLSHPQQSQQPIQYQPYQLPSQQQQIQNQQPLQQSWGGYAPPSFYQELPGESRKINFPYQYQVENMNLPQRISTSPQYTGEDYERYSTHESVSNLSDSRTNSSTRGPQSYPTSSSPQSFPTVTSTGVSYVPPPSPRSRDRF